MALCMLATHRKSNWILTTSHLLKRLYSMNEGDQIKTEKVGKVFMVGINQPSKRNCMNVQVSQKLTKAFETFENDPNLNVAILHGCGGTFCSGFDVNDMDSDSAASHQAVDSTWRHMGPTALSLSKPVIAAVAGHAVAGGLELALWCDLRIVEETAVLGLYSRRLGVPLLDGGSVRLPALIGLSHAMDLILTGRSINGPEAHRIGLANRLVCPGTAVGEALTMAQHLSLLPQQAMHADRQSALNAAYNNKSYQEALHYEWNNGQAALHAEGVYGAKTFIDGKGRHGKSMYFSVPNKKMGD